MRPNLEFSAGTAWDIDVLTLTRGRSKINDYGIKTIRQPEQPLRRRPAVSRSFRRGFLAPLLAVLAGCASSLPPRQAAEVIVLWESRASEKLLDCRRVAALEEPIRDRPEKDKTPSAFPAVGVLRTRSARMGANVLIAYWGGTKPTSLGNDASEQAQWALFVQGTAYLCESEDSLRRLAEDPVRVPSSSL